MSSTPLSRHWFDNISVDRLPTPTEALALDGLDWTSPVADISDTLIYAGFHPVSVERLIARNLR